MHNPIKSQRCFCCGSRYRLAGHHCQPRESGGLNEGRNLITLCATCHNAVEGQQEGFSAGEIWSNVLKRKQSFRQESAGRKRYRLSRENAKPCPAYVSWDERQRLTEEKRRGELNAMSLQEYFEQPDTPDRNSPAGILMLAVFEKFPGIAFEQAREKAYALLDCAAGKRVYRIRPVLTEEEQAARRDAVRARFGHGRKPETVSVTA